MKARVLNTNQLVEVAPYYLYGRIVAYVGDNVIEGIDLGGKYAYLPDELNLDIHDGE